jgi:hypothetical protein
VRTTLPVSGVASPRERRQCAVPLRLADYMGRGIWSRGNGNAFVIQSPGVVCVLGENPARCRLVRLDDGVTFAGGSAQASQGLPRLSEPHAGHTAGVGSRSRSGGDVICITGGYTLTWARGFCANKQVGTKVAREKTMSVELTFWTNPASNCDDSSRPNTLEVKPGIRRSLHQFLPHQEG